MSNRWSYQVLELTPSMLGPSMSEQLSDELNRLGEQGWELVSMTQITPFDHVRLVLKKEA
ncbi:hypothetical protein N792_05295 [Lysobacter concretionis Ko07 = DSM 16239]|jgi:hypothetical protein|uniref:DUF4177 domain-containing protein n=1 Tax=Lysobacter concretionis Ko07 = DSM 16239 TaxID=1122185 RepID=A0A0A0EQI6_9GAMM|nr:MULTISPECIES: DUF4177 domain-containing protein [Lysobacter]KGM52485.1 hypothetical protein N792_05295 [Lysobacter concretionis Ko07 = DSM 16239]QOD91762.1 DUF4177 domain-containing protein [Lysobacter sp. CW239]